MEFPLLYHAFFLLGICFLVLLVSCNPVIKVNGEFSSSPFPRSFLFGTASSSYQYEGAFLTDGKGLNNWDNFTHKPGNIMDGSNGDVAVDHYHRYLQDLDLMDYLGVNSYRFSISWARVLPNGRFGDVNWAGIDHYNKLINALLLKGIQPFVTLTHYDIPQELEDRYGAWLSREVQTKYQKEQEGNIGIVMNVLWLEPMSNSLEDKLAAERAQAFYLNWFLDPIIFGKYPKEMYEILGSSLPSFSKYDLEKLKNGLDFIGINHYTSFYVKDCIFSVCEPGPGNSKTEGSILRTAKRNGVLIGEPTDVDWLFVYPQGMSEIVTYIKERYNNIPMYITENGFGERDNPHTSIEDLLNDTRRVRYMSNHLDSLAIAVRCGITF
ncbi:hypothetical protein CUMW_009970 [Citrus unshiu]|nr:hypothetical protein CUMW_009970 [Citrus unshiu]